MDRFGGGRREERDGDDGLLQNGGSGGVNSCIGNGLICLGLGMAVHCNAYAYIIKLYIW